ncbi:MAG TPA: sigma-70 family RNA polymerase sigma factor, partial [Blastocatellia bacterium]|nr:sigma-70 family RNA polymerase sigma factor [Blastocatellia bacterium]
QRVTDPNRRLWIMMTVEEFQKAFAREIEQLLARIERRYSVSADDLAGALYSSAKKYLGDTIEQTSGNPGPAPAARQALSEYVESLNADDLCLAVACAKGDDAAWEDFFRDYRSYMVSIARTMTQDASAAEQLADSTFAELYGLRESGGSRVSKFSFYSGRGSLRGWLRAVVFQLSADLHRQSSRFVQTEEPEDMDRLVRASDVSDREAGAETGFIRERYRAAVSDALRRAISDLEPRERLLMAYYYYDEMTLREIGQLFNVHEATISRWLTKVQKRTRKLVEKSLARDHHFNRREVTEAIELAAERMDINVREYLYESAAAEREAERGTKNRGGVIAPR